jgi:hypothetical protein
MAWSNSQFIHSMIRDFTGVPLGRSIDASVVLEEARHIAFGRLALEDAYAGLSEAERERFVVEPATCSVTASSVGRCGSTSGWTATRWRALLAARAEGRAVLISPPNLGPSPRPGRTRSGR